MSNRPSSSSTARWWIVAAVAGVVVAALVVAVVAVNRSSSPTTGSATAGFDTSPDAPADLIRGEVEVTGTPLPPQGEAASGQQPEADPAVGIEAPAISGQRFDGEPITIPAAGKPKVVMFLAHWCPHCQREVPVITGHLGGQLPTDVDLYAVSTGVAENRPNFPPGDWLRRESWPVPTLVDDANSSAAQAYGLSGFPFFVAVDASGKVVARVGGELTPAQFDALVDQARGGG